MLSIYPWQQAQWQRLQRAAARDRTAHALLLSGPEGLGMEHFARVWAARVLCEQPVDTGPCGDCRSCVLFQAGSHPDFLWIEPEAAGKAIRVEPVRDLIEYLQLSSQYDRGKIAVITPAEAMNRNAANSLLKTLEEPPPDSRLILISNRPARLPVTIRSRCQQVNFNSREDETARSWLAGRLDNDAERAAELLAMARGRPLAALSLNDDETLQAQTAVLADLAALSTRRADTVTTARKWLDHTASAVLEWLLVFIQAMAREKLLPGNGQDTRMHRDLQELAERLDLVALLEWYDIVLSSYRAAAGPYNLNQQGLLEEVIVAWQDLSEPSGRSQQ